ncbi:MAG: fused MFS/spermidine synthase [Bacteroidetes bacterium]|nr:fused MFS/spermidine synthase [Bacteroidota bacterium]
MDYPFLFRLSSYFFDRLVYQTHSVHNAELRVMLHHNKFILDSGRANYSFGNLHQAFQRAFAVTKLRNKSPKNALILGFGAGSIAHILQKELKFNCSITGVEIDSEVLKLAKLYFDFDKLRNCSVIEDDALHYLESSYEKFDLIAVDLFQEIDVPEQFQQTHFITLLKAHLADAGKLYFNYVLDNPLHESQFALVAERFTAVFPFAKTLVIPGGNRMLMNY